MHRQPDCEHLYAWQCFACDASNPATAALCTTCGFPARATAKQIDAARAAGTSVTAKPIELQGRSAIDAIAQTLAPLPMWRQALVVIGGLLGIGGIVWLKLAWSFAGTAWSLGAVALGIVLFCAGTGRK
jgi:hypothetical protein